MSQNFTTLFFMIILVCLFCLQTTEARPNFHGAKLVHEYNHQHGKYIEMFEFPSDCDRFMLRGKSMLASLVDMMMHSF